MEQSITDMFTQQKRILDSVHGYIYIPEYYTKKIVDTIFFQRLRRVEQTSCRALFPCARHDRFIHSLGVYHIGCQIAHHLYNKNIKSFINNHQVTTETVATIMISYVLACLLHDIGHTPFSHTFEKYFEGAGNDTLRQILERELQGYENDSFVKDYINPSQGLPAPHEIISAILSVREFKSIIEAKGQKWEDLSGNGNVALVARMITGRTYSDNEHNLQNIFIELLHSKIIDADGLDYVCRDVWASGYATSRVDIDRVIYSMRIHCENNSYTLCYDAKAINDVRSVLEVKYFQETYVFGHHLMKYEQDTLIKAMESAALYHNRASAVDDPKERADALNQLCNVKCFTEGISTNVHLIPIRYPMDDDFIGLMKYCLNDKYVKQWFSRQYDLIPIWKSKERYMFDVKDGAQLASNYFVFINSDKGKQFLVDKFNIEKSTIKKIDVNDSSRRTRINNLMIYTDNQDIKRYTDIYQEEQTCANTLLPVFAYIYIPRIDKDGHPINIENVRMEFIKWADQQYHIVYFKNTLGWSDVYVTFFTEGVWKDQDNNVVPNGKAGDNGKMTLVEGTTDVYSFGYKKEYATVCFMSQDMHGWADFNGGAACYRGDFDASKSMFEPNTSMNHDSKTTYYNNGSWSTYASSAPTPCPNCEAITKQEKQ